MGQQGKLVLFESPMSILLDAVRHDMKKVVRNGGGCLSAEYAMHDAIVGDDFSTLTGCTAEKIGEGTTLEDNGNWLSWQVRWRVKNARFRNSLRDSEARTSH